MFGKKQRRSSARKVRDHGAWITMDGDVQSFECHVLDVSAGGAKLTSDIDAQIGSVIRLSISPNAMVRKPCKVIWRNGRQIGFNFIET
jgi:PilZ domain-containing protein